MDLWNEKSLPVPPINTYKARNTNIDIKHLHNVFCEGKNFFENEKFMHAEYAVLSRIVYRMKQKFRSAKDFKALEKLNKALDNYFEMDISSNLKQFKDLIPSKHRDDIYLPTKNLLDYILVRLQGLVKLMERIVETSKIAAYLLDKRMHTGHFWKIAFITFSLVSRVYILARYTAKFVCDLYRKLLPFSNQLKNTSSGWLPSGYILPKDLTEWINVDWLEFDDEVQVVEVPTEIPDIMKFFDLVDDDDDVQFCDEYFIVDDDAEISKDFKKYNKIKCESFLEKLGELRGFDSKEDIGEVIEIEDSFRDSVLVPVYDEDEDENKIISKMDINNFGRNLQKPRDSSVIDLLEDTGINQSLDSSDVLENIISDSSVLDLTEKDISTNMLPDHKSEHEFKNNKRRLNYDVLSISDSDNESSLDESEENVITLSDASLLETSHELEKGKLKNQVEKSKQEKNIDTSNAMQENIIVIPDAPIVDIKRMKTKINTKSGNSGRIVNKKIRNQGHQFSNMSKDLENVITLSDASLLETSHELEKGKLKKQVEKSKHERNIDISNTNINNKENIIVIPDTPIVDIKRIKNKINKKSGNSGRIVNKKIRNQRHQFSNTSNDLENVIVLDTPLKSVDVKPKKNKLDKGTKKLRKASKQLNYKADFRSFESSRKPKGIVNLQEPSMAKQKKAPKSKVRGKLNATKLENSIDNLQRGNCYPLDGKTKQKFKKLRNNGMSQKKLGNNRYVLKSNSKKLKLAVKSLSEIGNIVNESRNNIPSGMSFTSKKQKKKNNGELRYDHKKNYSDTQTKPRKPCRGGKKQINCINEKVSKLTKTFKKSPKSDKFGYRNLLHSDIANNTIGNTSMFQTPKTNRTNRRVQNNSTPRLSVKNRNLLTKEMNHSNNQQKKDVSNNLKRKEKKKLDLSSSKITQINLSARKIKQTRSNTSAGFKKNKKLTNKNDFTNLHKKVRNQNERSFIYIPEKVSQPRLQQSNVSSAGASSNNPKKRKRYWEYADEVPQSNNFVGLDSGFRKKKNQSYAAAEEYIPLIVSSRKKANAFVSHSKLRTGKKANAEKKKKNKMVNNFARSSSSQKVNNKASNKVKGPPSRYVHKAQKKPKNSKYKAGL